jgi:hypothetical protein
MFILIEAEEERGGRVIYSSLLSLSVNYSLIEM